MNKYLTVSTGAGVILALCCAEILLRPVSASWYYPAGALRTISQYSEGVGTAHFVPDTLGVYGNRLTGQPEVPGAPSVIFLGDSHLVQEALEDRETLAAVVERQSRTAGRPVNAQQFGWFGAGIATYLGVAADVLARKPWGVVVVINQYDFVEFEDDAWRMRIEPDLTVQLIPTPKPPGGVLSAKARDIAARSSLALALSRRAAQLKPVGPLGEARPGSSPPAPGKMMVEQMPLVCVRALHRLYGDRLLIAYTPWCRPSCQQGSDPVEERFLKACQLEGTACLTIRSAMAAEERQKGYLHRGFHNTGPGQGHLNREGMRVLGESIWAKLASRK